MLVKANILVAAVETAAARNPWKHATPSQVGLKDKYQKDFDAADRDVTKYRAEMLSHLDNPRASNRLAKAHANFHASMKMAEHHGGKLDRLLDRVKARAPVKPSKAGARVTKRGPSLETPKPHKVTQDSTGKKLTVGHHVEYETGGPGKKHGGTLGSGYVTKVTRSRETGEHMVYIGKGAHARRVPAARTTRTGLK